MKHKLLLTIFLTCALGANAQSNPPSDLYPDESLTSAIDNTDDANKSAVELFTEGSMLLMDERLLDARSKLLLALQKDPRFYKAHILLAGYYTSHVGHFRLALKYIKRAEELFREEVGPGPYNSPELRLDHAQILYMQSQIRLSLDEYDKALDVLDRFEAAGYFGGWYPGTRGWVLMKLGRISEAIEVARVGVLAGAEPGRTLNMLGILYSVNNQRQTAIKVFDEAIDYEFAMGATGQPATPLNNQAEVYREEFDEDRAETGWSRALALPDGCEHVLPALNLSTMLNEQLRYEQSWRTMMNFNQCVAQFALRNGEEHRALVNLALGRIEMHTGRNDNALQLIGEALEERQWFGKIGTNIDDMQAGASISLAQALRQRNNILRATIPDSIASRASIAWEMAKNRLRRWWLLRKTRMLLSAEMKSFEDISIRNTDSLIEYPWLGELISSFPSATALKRIAAEESGDKRPAAKRYYDAYRAEVFFNQGDYRRAESLIAEILPMLRERKDAALLLKLRLLRLAMLPNTSAQYQAIAIEVFKTERSVLLTSGLKLPVQIQAPDSLKNALTRGAFQLSTSPLMIEGKAEGQSFELRADLAPIGGREVVVKGTSVAEATNRFTSEIFKSLVKTSKEKE